MTRAARELGETPAAVSIRIRNLEGDLGAPLFVRSGPRIMPTDAATTLAGRIAAAIDELREAVQACRQAPSRIRITAVPTLAARWLAGALTEYHRANPHIDVVVDSTDLLRPAGGFDLSLRHGKGKWSGVAAHPIFGAEVTPMVAPRHADAVRTSRQLARLPLVPDARWNQWFATFGPRPERVSFTANYPSQELAAAAAAAGAGAALLSPVLFAAFLREGKLVCPFRDVLNKGDRYFLAIAENERRPSVLELRDFLIAHAEGWH